MSIKMSLIAAAACLACAVTGATYAAEAAHEGPAMSGMHEGMKDGMHERHHGKRCAMKGGMKCSHHQPDMLMLPRLPAGNEKLQLQMHAEILQKIGEIEAKYAAQLP